MEGIQPTTDPLIMYTELMIINVLIVASSDIIQFGNQSIF